jgi:hypothetical protein
LRLHFLQRYLPGGWKMDASSPGRQRGRDFYPAQRRKLSGVDGI